MTSPDPSTTFSLCLTTTSAVSGGQQRKIITIASSASVHDVYQAARQAFLEQFPNQEIAAMRFGFPPKLLDKVDATTPIHTILSNQERIQVEFSATTTSKSNTTSTAASKQRRGGGGGSKKKAADKNRPDATSATAADSLSPSSTAQSSPSKRPSSQRAAAKAASEGFAAAIQAQDQFLTTEQRTTTTKPRTAKTATSNKRPRTTASPKHNKTTATASAAASSSSPHTTHSNARYFQQAAEPGRRLGDGAAISENAIAVSPSSSSHHHHHHHHRRRQQQAETWNSEDDISSALMNALNGGGGGSGGKVGGILRKAMRNAVSQSYETSRAVVRVAAITGKAYTMMPIVSSTTAATSPSTTTPDKLQVRYDKGVEGRGQLEETVDFIPKEALEAVISAIYQSNPQALRPVRLAQLSPRVLWSLVYHMNHPPPATTATTVTTEATPTSALLISESETTTTVSEATTTDTTLSLPSTTEPITETTTTDLPESSISELTPVDSSITTTSTTVSVEEALQLLLPQLDWSYMRNRKRTLSEKAKENLRQQLEQDKATAGVVDDDSDQEETEEGLQHAQETILAVQNAMETIHDWDSQLRRNRMAQAAMARLAPGNTSDDGSASSPNQSSWTLATPSETDEDELVACIKPTAATLIGTEESEHADDDEIEKMIQTIVQALINDCQIHNWRELANANAAIVAQHLNTSAMPTITIQTVEAWIDVAQGESVDEIMVEVCDGQVDMVEQLRDVAHSGTPKDLSGWRHVPQMLWNEARLDQVEVASSNNVTVETLASWCQRAHQVLQEREFEWLQWYATPIE